MAVHRGVDPRGGRQQTGAGEVHILQQLLHGRHCVADIGGEAGGIAGHVQIGGQPSRQNQHRKKHAQKPEALFDELLQIPVPGDQREPEAGCHQAAGRADKRHCLSLLLTAKIQQQNKIEHGHQVLLRRKHKDQHGIAYTEQAQKERLFCAFELHHPADQDHGSQEHQHLKDLPNGDIPHRQEKQQLGNQPGSLGKRRGKESEQRLPQVVLVRPDVPEHVRSYQIAGIRRVYQIKIIPPSVDVCTEESLRAEIGEYDHHGEQESGAQEIHPFREIRAAAELHRQIPHQIHKPEKTAHHHGKRQQRHDPGHEPDDNLGKPKKAHRLLHPVGTEGIEGGLCPVHRRKGQYARHNTGPQGPGGKQPLRQIDPEHQEYQQRQ